MTPVNGMGGDESMPMATLPPNEGQESPAARHEDRTVARFLQWIFLMGVAIGCAAYLSHLRYLAGDGIRRTASLVLAEAVGGAIPLLGIPVLLSFMFPRKGRFLVRLFGVGATFYLSCLGVAQQAKPAADFISEASKQHADLLRDMNEQLQSKGYFETDSKKFEQSMRAMKEKVQRLDGKGRLIGEALLSVNNQLLVLCKSYEATQKHCMEPVKIAAIQTHDQLDAWDKAIREFDEANARLLTFVENIDAHLSAAMANIEMSEWQRREAFRNYKDGGHIEVVLAIRKLDQEVAKDLLALNSLLRREWGKWRIQGHSVVFDQGSDAVAEFNSIVRRIGATGKKQADLQWQYAQKDLSPEAFTKPLIPTSRSSSADPGGKRRDDTPSPVSPRGVTLAKCSPDEIEGMRSLAEAGDASAQLFVGKYHWFGGGHARDVAEGARWFRKAADQGHAKAQMYLGWCYSSGKGVLKNETEAAKWYRKAAEQGDADAQIHLAVRYEGGRGVSKDATEALKWFRKAGEGGILPAQVMLWGFYNTGDRVPQDYTEAAKWIRMAAEQGSPIAQMGLATLYETGRGVPKDIVEAAKWNRMAAEQGNSEAQFCLAAAYRNGMGVAEDQSHAVKWSRKAAEQGHAKAQFNLGMTYRHGKGVPKDENQAANWFRMAAELGDADAQIHLAACYGTGGGVPRDDVQAYKWALLASSGGNESAKRMIPSLERQLSLYQRSEGQRLMREFKSHSSNARSGKSSADTKPRRSGTAFFVTDQGHLVTNAHVVYGANFIVVLTESGIFPAEVLRVDEANDFALLKVEGVFPVLAITPSQNVRLGTTVATVGFPNVELQGFSPKLAKGEIASLSGVQDDPRQFQVSVPVQPGNSGGPLFDERGNVIGVLVAKLNQKQAFAVTGAIPENVNYAVKSSDLLEFLEAYPELVEQLREPATSEREFEDVVGDVQNATALVLVTGPEVRVVDQPSGVSAESTVRNEEPTVPFPFPENVAPKDTTLPTKTSPATAEPTEENLPEPTPVIRESATVGSKRNEAAPFPGAKQTKETATPVRTRNSNQPGTATHPSQEATTPVGEPKATVVRSKRQQGMVFHR